MKRGVFVLLALSSGLMSLANSSGSWPQFRGPQGNGHPAGPAEVPLSWGPRENVRWKLEIPGKGWSSPVVANGRVFLTTAVETGGKLSLRTFALNLDDGSPAWEQEIFSVESVPSHQKNSQASPTPVFDDGRLYTHFGHLGTACLDAGSGAILWTQTSLTYQPVHGNGGSPVLFQDKLIFSCDGAKDPFVVALETEDGSIAWKTPRDVDVQRTFSFSTPLIIEVEGENQAVVPGSGAVISYDPATGKEIWRCRYGEGYSVVPRPIYHDGLLYVSSGFGRASLFAIRANGAGDVTESHIAWQDDKAIPKESSPIIAEGLLFVNDDKGILSCFDPKTGAEHFRERLDEAGGYSSSPVYASGHLFFHNGEGVTTVVKPARSFQKVGENRLEEYGLSSFAVLPDGFLIRTEGHLFRIGK